MHRTQPTPAHVFCNIILCLGLTLLSSGVCSLPLSAEDDNAFVSILTEPQKQKLYDYLNTVDSYPKESDSETDDELPKIYSSDTYDPDNDIDADKRGKWSIAYGKRSKWSIAYGKRDPWSIAYGKRSPWNIAYGKRSPWGIAYGKRGKWNIAYGKRSDILEPNADKRSPWGIAYGKRSPWGIAYGKRSPWGIAYGKRSPWGIAYGKRDGGQDMQVPFNAMEGAQYSAVPETEKRQQGMKSGSS